MANETVTEASQVAGNLPVDPMVIAGVLGITALIGGGIYLYFNPKQYNFFTRFISWSSGKIQGEQDDEQIDEKMEETTKKAAEKQDFTNVDDPEELWRRIEAWGEQKEHEGRMEERRKQREDENLKDILIITLIAAGANLLLRLWNMFGGAGAA